MSQSEATAKQLKRGFSLPYSHQAVWLRIYRLLSFLVALALGSAIYGGVPFVSIPTLGQGIWTSGFAQSFANAGWPTIFAKNFAYPSAAPIAFGLSGAFVESTLISLAALHPADAYSLMTMLYLGLALWGALQYAKTLGLTYMPALVLATVWISSPMIWAHAGYSMLSLGIALLPFYLWVGQLLIRLEGLEWRRIVIRVFAFVVTAILAIFMDGYTFMMFIVGMAVQMIFAMRFPWRSGKSQRMLTITLPTFGAGLFLSYMLYQAYLGSTEFSRAPIDFFRGWGCDITMLFVPTKGLLWLWDQLGVGESRSPQEYFGDMSVWVTTFSIIPILLGCAGFWLTRGRKCACPLLIIAIFGTYMSLGPSLKVYSVRPEKFIQAGNMSPLMPAEVAVASTGTALISEKLPGFNYMRASYRWMALALFGLWALYVLLSIELQRRGLDKSVIMIALLVLISNLPNPVVRLAHSPEPYISVRLRAPVEWRADVYRIDKELLLPLRKHIKLDSVVAFMPAGNDFLANYLSAAGNFKTFNVGGDKNMEIARKKWPSSIREAFFSEPGNLAAHIKEVLLHRQADYVVIPFISLLWHAHGWPPQSESVQSAKDKYSATLDFLASDSRFGVMIERYFAVVSLKETR